MNSVLVPLIFKTPLGDGDAKDSRRPRFTSGNRNANIGMLMACWGKTDVRRDEVSKIKTDGIEDALFPMGPVHGERLFLQCTKNAREDEREGKHGDANDVQ